VTAAARSAFVPRPAALQARLEPVRFVPAYAAGRALTLDEAIALGRSLVALAGDGVGVRVRRVADAS
jgi:hypothetical protein